MPASQKCAKPKVRGQWNQRRLIIIAAGVLTVAVACNSSGTGDARPNPERSGHGQMTTLTTLTPDGQPTGVEATIEVGNRPVGLAATDQAVWVAVGDDGVVARIDPATNQIVTKVDVGGTPRSVAATADAVWVTDNAGVLTRIDPDTNHVAARIAVSAFASDVAATNDAVWVTGELSGTVTRLATRSASRTRE